MADLTIGGLGAQAFALTDLLPHEPLAGPPAKKGDINALITLLNTVYGTGPFLPLAGGTMTGLLTIAQATANTSAFASTGYSLTGANAQSLMSLAGTINTSGNPSVFRLATTVTAAGATTKLFELLAGAAGATSVLSVSTVGALSAAEVLSSGQIVGPSGTSISSGGNLRLKASGYIIPSADGVWGFFNEAVADFGRIKLGGSTVAFPSIKRNGAGVDFRLADDSAYTVITASMLRLSPALTVATLPAAGTQGRIAYVTDALAPAFLAIAVGGGAIVTTVFDNGTNWVSV